MVNECAYNRAYDMIEDLERRLVKEFHDTDVITLLLSYSLVKLRRKYKQVINIEDLIAYVIREALEGLQENT